MQSLCTVRSSLKKMKVPLRIHSGIEMRAIELSNFGEKSISKVYYIGSCPNKCSLHLYIHIGTSTQQTAAGMSYAEDNFQVILQDMHRFQSHNTTV